MRVLELPTAKELAKFDGPGDGRHFSVGPVSPDGSVVAVNVAGKLGAPLEVWFRDARTLEDHGKLVGKEDPERYGWGPGKFTPDGKRYVALDGAGTVLVWDVAGRKPERSVPCAQSGWGQVTVSPDGKTAAIGWMPKVDPGLENTRDPDPQDLPQPRVTLIDLAGKAPPRTLVAPHGSVGEIAFSPDGKTLAFGSTGATHLFDLTK